MIHGVLNVYKEKGYTSHDVIAKLRGITGQKKIGHTGTLDPEAEGVLPVCFGKATRLCDMLTDKDKCYETVMLLGVETDTQDMTGKVIGRGDTSGITEEEVRTAAESFEGDYEQVPPMYSALKVNGKKLYELAREGKVVERKARKVTIHEIEIMKISLPRVSMRVCCSKGTYIRTLCRDIGEKLGCTACMEELVRTRVSDFTLQDSATLSEIERREKDGTLEELLRPIDQMFPELKRVTAAAEWEKSVRNGGAFPEKGTGKEGSFDESERVRVYDRTGAFIGIYGYKKGEGIFTPVKMFYLVERD